MTDRLEIASRQIEFARQYTRTLLDGIDDDQWFEMPAGLPTHIAWQVGHLAMAEYGLLLYRQRGRERHDVELMGGRFRKAFSRGSKPLADDPPANHPSPDEIRSVLQAVHGQAMNELATFSDAHLDEPIEEPYAAYATKYGALLFCASHEMLHAGQIGLIRRLLGKDPVR